MTERSAFPYNVFVSDEDGTHQIVETGLSIRDYFAAAALQGMLADLDMNGEPDPVAVIAYNYADAMMAEREKRK
jgi:hypothetical protein